MKQLKCNSCGAELKVDENKEYAICEHCGSKYKLNEGLNINFKMDDNVKEVISAINTRSKIFSKIVIIPFVIFIIAFAWILISAFKAQSDFEKNVKDNGQDNEEAGKEIIDQLTEEALRSKFNFKFSSATGTKSGFFLKDILDNINESNKTNGRKVTLVFNGNSTKDETEIINIKHGLKDNDQFEVVVNYDDGYVYEINVTSLN